ncbi:URAD [Bugula neritina]|uniref:2-oxo-4-hydroxy-4-carboxy-5-ureidoimidazoline decarboxylase n=1 Tax=Bugula neritina TaxID=10212 RepID=A0A7J7KFA0_BUGNE|nr:URAD [Bugula neritina]
MLITEVNKMRFKEFIRLFGNVIENCPLVAAAVWSDLPVRNLESLQTSIEKFVDQLSSAGKVGMLRCLPDLAGRLAAAGQMSDDSKLEQKAAGLDDLTPSEKSQINSLNKRYKDKFGFPFVICARENKKDAILKGLAQRLNNEKDQEIRIGVSEVKKICWLRLTRIVSQRSSL